MDPFDAGWLSLLPPIIAITLALITKEVISSLFLGILSGTVIYCLGMGTGDLIIKPVEIAFTTMVNTVGPESKVNPSRSMRLLRPPGTAARSSTVTW